MAAGFQPLHPRRLYSSLCACPSIEARAHAALEFLCGCTSSARGMLFIERNGTLACLAHTPSLPVSGDLIQEAERIWARQNDLLLDDSRTRTIDLQARRKPDIDEDAERFVSASGVTFDRRLLATGRALRFIPVGVVMLEANAKNAPLRHAYVESICNAFIDAGDIIVPTDPELNPR